MTAIVLVVNDQGEGSESLSMRIALGTIAAIASRMGVSIEEVRQAAATKLTSASIFFGSGNLATCPPKIVSPRDPTPVQQSVGSSVCWRNNVARYVAKRSKSSGNRAGHASIALRVSRWVGRL